MASSAFGSIIEKFFYKNGGWSRLKGELSVYYWPKVAGAEIAKKVEAVRFRDGYLYLQTDVPALAQQILFMVPSFLEKYRRFIGKGVLKGIKVKIGSIKRSLSNPDLSINDFSLEPTDLSKIETCRSSIDDPDLAARFEKLMKKSYLVRKKQAAEGGKECLSCGVIIDSKFDYCPCCENKVHQEIRDYISYQKNHHPEQNTGDPSQFEGLSHLKIKKTRID